MCEENKIVETKPAESKEETGFKWGRFFSMSLFILVIITTLIAGVIYLIYAKDKSNAILAIVLFALPAVMSSGFVYIVSSASVQEKISGYLKMVGDSSNQLASLAINKNGTITAQSSIMVQPAQVGAPRI